MKRIFYTRTLLALILALLTLAACTSGVQDEPQTQIEDLEAQATNNLYRKVYESAADAEESESGYMYLPNADLDMISDSANPERGEQKIGLRFHNIDIPQGATITKAWIKFTVDEPTSGNTTVGIKAIDQDDAPLFNTSTNITGRPKTSAGVSWSIPPWEAENDSGDAQTTPDLKALVQEIVNRPGWRRDNNIAFVFANGGGERVAKSRDAGLVTAPQLYVQYENGAPPTSVGTTCLTSSNPIVPTDTTSLRLKGLSTNAQVKLTGKTITGVPSENPTAVRIEDNGSGLCISGGKLKTDAKDTSDWNTIFHGGRNFVRILGSKGAKIERVAGDTAGDALGITSVRWVSGQKTAPASDHAENWSLSHSYFRHTGDDIVDNDMRAAGTIDNVLVDWTYVGIACRASGYGFERAPGTMTVKNTLFAMKPQASGFRGATNTYGYPFKWDETKNFDKNKVTNSAYRKPCPLALNNVTIYMATKPSGPSSVFDSQGYDPVDYVTECNNVTFLYGGTGYPHKAQLSKLQQKFGSSCFKIIEGSAAKTEWNTRRDQWFADHDKPGFEHIQAYRYSQPLKP